jgi:hypothetical protein
LIQIKKIAPAIRLMAFMNKIKDYLLRQHLSLWHPISTAPNNHDLELKVLDGASSVALPFPCRRTNAGEWINADLETGIDIQPTKWRPWQKAKARNPGLSMLFRLFFEPRRKLDVAPARAHSEGA